MIREAEERDLGRITELTAQLGYATTEGAISRRLRALAETGDDVVFVIDVSGACVGWIHVNIVQSLESDPFAEIRGLVVDESVRGGGHGTTLIRAAEEWARSRNCPRIRLRTNVKRVRAHEFYKSRGFSMVKEQKVFEKAL
jgi:N-acetylglutamate synthase-like GNAT family acetyltransferase